ncbi:MAG: hypothetical protein ACOZQL_34635 [Myxococcota bacterium]
MIRLTLVVAALLATPILANEGEVDCAQTGCTCSAGQCPLHRPGSRPRLPAFDASTVRSFSGVIVAIERDAHGREVSGVTLTVQRGPETVVVHLGPAPYIDERAQFTKGDLVEVTGSHVVVDGQAAVLSTRIKRGERVLKLRDDAGVPLFRLHES